VEASEGGSLIIKAIFYCELQFYQSLQQDPILPALPPFTPKFLGMLMEGTVDTTSQI
jgi:hypothetical protein